MPYKDIETRRACQRKYYLANREKQLAKTKAWYKKHPEAVRAKTKKEIAKDPEKYAERIRKWHSLNKEAMNATKRKRTELLNDNVVKHIIKRAGLIPPELISNEMIAAKREHIRVNRLLKELKK